MLFDNLHYDPVKDIQEVDQFGWIDLREAYVTGSVTGDSAPDDNAYNDIDEPGSIIGKPRDVFEGIELGKRISIAGAVHKESGENGD